MSSVCCHLLAKTYFEVIDIASRKIVQRELLQVLRCRFASRFGKCGAQFHFILFASNLHPIKHSADLKLTCGLVHSTSGGTTDMRHVLISMPSGLVHYGDTVLVIRKLYEQSLWHGCIASNKGNAGCPLGKEIPNSPTSWLWPSFDQQLTQEEQWTAHRNNFILPLRLRQSGKLMGDYQFTMETRMRDVCYYLILFQ